MTLTSSVLERVDLSAVLPEGVEDLGEHQGQEPLANVCLPQQEAAAR